MPLVGPYPADLMAADPANPALNKPSFEGPDCLIPPAAAETSRVIVGVYLACRGLASGDLPRPPRPSTNATARRIGSTARVRGPIWLDG